MHDSITGWNTRCHGSLKLVVSICWRTESYWIPIDNSAGENKNRSSRLELAAEVLCNIVLNCECCESTHRSLCMFTLLFWRHSHGWRHWSLNVPFVCLLCAVSPDWLQIEFRLPLFFFILYYSDINRLLVKSVSCGTFCFIFRCSAISTSHFVFLRSYCVFFVGYKMVTKYNDSGLTSNRREVEKEQKVFRSRSVRKWSFVDVFAQISDQLYRRLW